MSYNNFSIIIPVYNELNNIEKLFNEIRFSLNNFDTYQIIFIDDGSTDDSQDILKDLENKKLIQLIKNKKNIGQSYSIYKGIKNAKYETIITLDGDGQNNPNDIPKLLKMYNETNNKLIGGIRINRKDNYIKKISSIIANNIRSFILKDNCKDTGCSLKIFDKKIFLSFPYFDGLHRFLPALFKGYGYNTDFINVSHRQRNSGNSKYGTLDRLFKGVRDIFIVNSIIKKINTK